LTPTRIVHSTFNDYGPKVEILIAENWNPQGLVGGEGHFWDPKFNHSTHNRAHNFLDKGITLFEK